jgi:hypothetical protein
VDTHERVDALLGHRVFLSVGHDEYWSWAMRDHVEAARARGINLVFLGANACFWQIRFEPGPDGAPNRAIVGYKDAAEHDDPFATTSDPANNRLVTGRWREPPVSRPEASMIGVMYIADPVDADVVAADASHWVFAGTGLANGDAMPGLLGYEVDAAPADARPDLTRLAHSPFILNDRTLHSDMTIYTAGSGALVFATGLPFISSGPLRCLARERHRRVKRHRVTAHGCLLDRIGLQSPPRDLDAALDIGTPGRWRRGADDSPQRLSGGG